MNDDQLDDLKQFIAASVSQPELRIRDDMDKRFDNVSAEFRAVREEIADGFAGVGEAVEEMNNRADQQGKAVDKRLAKLEQKAA